MNSELLRTFIAVAAECNVTHAAQLINKTQSAVSAQIKRLEDSLETQLFERGARGVELTAAGELLLREATPILAQLEQTRALFTGKKIGGQVRVGIPDEYVETILPGILARFARLHRGVEVSVRCEFSVSFPEAIRRGELDIALYACREPEADDEILNVEQTVWAACKNQSFPADEPVPLALFERSCWWRDEALTTLEKAGRQHRIAYTSESLTGVKAAISAGLAVGVIAQRSVDDSMRVLGINDHFPALQKSCLVMLQAEPEPSAAIKAMAQAIREGFSRALR